MSRPEIVAGIDAGHVHTKAIVMRGHDLLGAGSAPTRLDPISAAQAALDEALAQAGIAIGDLTAIVATGIYRDVIGSSRLRVTRTVPEHMADASGALFFNEAARTIVDIGGNIHKVVRFDGAGNLLDVAQNDKCADGLGFFFSTAAGSLGLSEDQMSELAAGASDEGALAIQCAFSAQSDATDLVCRGIPGADVAGAILGYVVERVRSLCRSMPLEREVVVAGGLARSAELVRRLQAVLGRDLSVPELPQYAGAIGAVMRGQP